MPTRTPVPPLRSTERTLPLCAAVLLAAAVCPAGIRAQVPNPRLDEAIRLYTGVAGRVDDAAAARLLEAAVADGDTLAVMWLARVHSRGRMGFPEDRDTASSLATTVIGGVRALAEAGVPEALFLMGSAHAEGLGVPVDPEEAVRWYRRAAAHGHVLAQHNLGNAYVSGTGVPPSDSLAMVWWRKAAVQGDAIPSFRLGTMYEEGRGVAPDPVEALRWYRQSAARGYEPARRAVERLQGR